jgi:Tfp pilus assembly protein PilO
MKLWLRQKSNQVFILIVALCILIFSNIILPGHEQIHYHTGQTANLKLQVQQLSRYELHIKHHQAQQAAVHQNTQRLTQAVSVWTSTKSLQTRLGQLQRAHKLKVVRQRIHESPLDDTFGQIEVQQSLTGSYTDHIGYLKALMAPGNLLILESGRFENTAPLVADPTLTADLTLKTFYRISKP